MACQRIQQELPVLPFRSGQAFGRHPVEVLVFIADPGLCHQPDGILIAALQGGPQKAIPVAVGHAVVAFIEQQTQRLIFTVAGSPQKLLRLRPQHRLILQPAAAHHCDDPQDGFLSQLHGPQPQAHGVGLAVRKQRLQLGIGGNGGSAFPGDGVGEQNGIAGKSLIRFGQIALRQRIPLLHPYPHGKEVGAEAPFLHRQHIDAEGRPQVQKGTVILIDAVAKGGLSALHRGGLQHPMLRPDGHGGGFPGGKHRTGKPQLLPQGGVIGVGQPCGALLFGGRKNRRQLVFFLCVAGGQKQQHDHQQQRSSAFQHKSLPILVLCGYSTIARQKRQIQGMNRLLILPRSGHSGAKMTKFSGAAPLIRPCAAGGCGRFPPPFGWFFAAPTGKVHPR